MGICASCLGLGRWDSHDAESTRLLDDDVYQSGYNYGGVNQGQHNGPDPEDVKREREALEAICQRTSDSVVDVWSAQQPYASTVPPAQRPTTSFSSRMPSTESAVTQVPAQSQVATPTQTSPQDQKRDKTSPTHGEFGNMKYVVYPNMWPPNDPSAVPKHWGEVVITAKKTRPSSDMSNGNATKDDIFGVLDAK